MGSYFQNLQIVGLFCNVFSCQKHSLLFYKSIFRKSLMITNIQYLKDRTLSASNIKKVHNYSYYTDKVIGAGYFSTVYQAFSHTTHQQIAAKVVKMNTITFKKLQQLLEQQIEVLLSLNHMNTIKCFDVLKTAEQCHIFMEYCEGGSLDKFLKQHGPMSEEQVWPYIKGIYQGLKYLNSKNIIHRDLKPANILLKGDKVKIADFGFAVHARDKFKDMSIGSPFYMAPEAFLESMYGEKTDVWSFGIIMYELLHGKTPFNEAMDGEALKLRIVIPIKSQDFKPEISFELKDLILRCLEIDQSKRITIKQIEQTSFMTKRCTSKLYSNMCFEQKVKAQSNKNQTHHYGNQKIIRIPSRLSVRKNAPQNLTNQNNEPDNKSCHEIYKLKCFSSNSLNRKIPSLLAQANRDPPQIINYNQIVYKASVIKPKMEINTQKYRCYPRLTNRLVVDNSINNLQ